MATFVLVPGGFHGGWCFVKIAQRLRSAGHEVFTPTLTGLGERSHLLTEAIDLETHIQDIMNVILWEGLEAVVLAGHAYGGFIITAVADRLPEKIASLVYIDAIIPEDGDTVVGRVTPAGREVYEKVKGSPILAPWSAEAMGIRAAEDQVWVDSKCTPQPMATLQQPIYLTGAYRTVKDRVLIYAVGGAHEAEYEGVSSEPGCTVRPIHDTGHEIMVDQPAALAAVLMEARR